MMAEAPKIKIRINDRVLSVIVFALLFAWLLAFPFEGQILYAIADSYGLDPHGFIFGAIAIHFAGLFSCGFVIKSARAAKRMLLFASVYCILGTCPFFFPIGAVERRLISASFVEGWAVASWGLYLKACTAKTSASKPPPMGSFIPTL